MKRGDARECKMVKYGRAVFRKICFFFFWVTDEVMNLEGNNKKIENKMYKKIININ